MQEFPAKMQAVNPKACVSEISNAIYSNLAQISEKPKPRENCAAEGIEAVASRTTLQSPRATMPHRITATITDIIDAVRELGTGVGLGLSWGCDRA